MGEPCKHQRPDAIRAAIDTAFTLDRYVTAVAGIRRLCDLGDEYGMDVSVSAIRTILEKS